MKLEIYTRPWFSLDQHPVKWNYQFGSVEHRKLGALITRR